MAIDTILKSKQKNQFKGVLWGLRSGGPVLILSALLNLLLLHPIVQADGIAYFIYLDSIAGDGDLNLRNQAIRFAQVISYHIFVSPTTGELVTAFPFGSAYLLAPFYWIGDAVSTLMPASSINHQHFVERQALGLPYSLAASFGACFYTTAAIGLAYATARRLTSNWSASIAAIACLIGTPLLHYTAIAPLDTHAYGTFLLSLALWFFVRECYPVLQHDATKKQDEPGYRSARYAFAIGLILGFAVLVRWQLLLYAVPVSIAFLYNSLKNRNPFSRWLASISFLIGISLFIGLCVLYFWRFFNALFVVPNEIQVGKPFIGPPLHHFTDVLFNTRNGWLSWSPIVILSIFGLCLLIRSRTVLWSSVALICLAGIALEIALNSSLYDWYGGWAFGQRRMTEAYAPLVLGLAWLIETTQWRKVTLAAITLCSIYSFILLIGYLYYTHTSTHPEGGNIVTTLSWLFSPEGKPPWHLVLRERYGPWAWSRPQL